MRMTGSRIARLPMQLFAKLDQNWEVIDGGEIGQWHRVNFDNTTLLGNFKETLMQPRHIRVNK